MKHDTIRAQGVRAAVIEEVLEMAEDAVSDMDSVDRRISDALQIIRPILASKSVNIRAILENVFELSCTAVKKEQAAALVGYYLVKAAMTGPCDILKIAIGTNDIWKYLDSAWAALDKLRSLGTGPDPSQRLGPMKMWACTGCAYWIGDCTHPKRLGGVFGPILESPYIHCPVHHERIAEGYRRAAQPIDYDQISPGVRDLVRELRGRGFETTDSGDGSNHAAGMECALPFRHVAIVTTIQDMEDVVAELAYHYPTAKIDASWSPGEPAVVLLMPDGCEDTSDSSTTSVSFDPPASEEPMRKKFMTRAEWIAACEAISGCENRPDEERLDGGTTVFFAFPGGKKVFKWKDLTPEQAMEQAAIAGLW